MEQDKKDVNGVDMTNWRTIVSIVLAIVVIGAIFFLARGAKNNEDMANDNQEESEIVESDVKEEEKSTIKSDALTAEDVDITKPAPVGLSYAEAVKAYGSNRMEFDAECKAGPAQATFKAGTRVMLGNQASAPVTIVVGENSYTIKGYGYRTISLVSATYPATIDVMCNSIAGVAKVTLTQ